jgi:putative component of toxin-antitoxin plasmid stabilization module
VYYGKIETACVLLLRGGGKRKQSADIKKALAYWKDYRKRTEME